ncbi:MAG TPA: hypothetical protein DCS93_42105 [Microscillaceae bacterium]|nr:hypothetical protein [Microscillaceae bacterium]
MKTTISCKCFLHIVAFLLLLLSDSYAQKSIFWGDLGKLGAVEKDGSNLRDLLINTDDPWAIDVDLSNQIVYWVDRAHRRINSTNSNTGAVALIHNLTNEPVDIAVDASAGKIYWIESTINQIKRSNIDGTSIEVLVSTGISDPTAISLDGNNNKIYWADQGNDQISRANFDGTSVEVVLTSTVVIDPQDVVVNGGGGNIYWSEAGTSNKIRRSDLNGSGVSDFISTGLVTPVGLALNLGNNEIFWTESGKIRNSDLTTPAANDRVANLGNPRRVVPDQTMNRLYYVDTQTQNVSYTDLSGMNPIFVVAPVIGIVKSLVYDGNDFVYYVDEVLQQIKRYRLSTNQVDDITGTNLGNISGLTLNKNTNELFWANQSMSEIQKSSTGGGGVSNITTYGPSAPIAFDIDVTNGHLYWAAPLGIYRSNLDGSGQTQLVNLISTDLGGFALDLTNGKMYWSDRVINKIERANLDGTVVEDFVTSLSSPGAILVDASNNHLYWTNGLSIASRFLSRIDLDGSNLQNTVATGVGQGMALVDFPIGEIEVVIESKEIANGNSFNFGTVASGNTKTYTVFIKNTENTGALSISNVRIVGSNGFSVSGTTTVVVSPNDTAKVSLTFTPVNNNAATDTLIIESDDLDENPYKITLKGNDGNSVSLPDIDLVVDGTGLTNGATYDFGSVSLNNSLTKTFLIQNSGGDTLKLKANNAGRVISTGGTDINSFAFDVSSTSAKIDPGASTSFTITFAPATLGAKSASFTIESNSPITPVYNINLMGSGETVPNPPQISNLQITSRAVVGEELVATLSWQDNADNETGFKIERAVNDSLNFVEVAQVGTDVTSYIDNTIQEGNQYYYRLKAFNNIGDSNPSNMFSLLLVGLGENNFKNTRIGPNPAKSHLVLKLRNREMGKIMMRFKTLDGKQLYSQQILKNTYELNIPISLANYPSGTYLIYLKSKQSQLIRRVVKL